MIQFPTHPDCLEDTAARDPKVRRCPLGSNCTHPGIPTRLADFPPTEDKPIALFVLGEAPGYFEDQSGRCWVHVCGKLLHKLLHAGHFEDIATIYLANAVRCRPPSNADPTPGQIRLCRGHLEADLRLIMAQHPQVYVLCMGAKAALAAGHKSIKSALRFQGNTHEWFPKLDPLECGTFMADHHLTDYGPVNLPTFYTYHPGALLPGRTFGGGRDPSHMRAVTDHLELLWEVMSGKREIVTRTIQPERATIVPMPVPTLVALDIETYGILKGQNQTVFHPRQSEVLDGIPRGSQIVTVALTWKETSPCGTSSASPPESAVVPLSDAGSTNSASTPGPLLSSPRGPSPSESGSIKRHAIFLWSQPEDRKRFQAWLAALAKAHSTIIGKNILFDLMYLRYNDVVCRYWLSIDRRLVLDDLSIWSHLDYELRPEKSLRPLGDLLGVRFHEPASVAGLAHAGVCSSDTDPALWCLNATDTATTFELREVLLDKIRRRYGANSPKLRPECGEFRSQLLWSTLYMAEAGVPLHCPALQERDASYRRRMARLSSMAAGRFDLIFSGEGSVTSLRDLMTEALLGDVMLPTDRITRTDKRKDISINDLNINLALQFLPRTHALYRPIRLLRCFRDLAYRVSHYTNPLLNAPRKGIVEVLGPIGMVYPSWHVVPSSYVEEGSEKGTIQGRITCTKPPLQTDPDWLKRMRTSRFPSGVTLDIDMAHLELRVAYLLSGEPTLGDCFRRGGDPHGELALRLMPEIPISDPHWRDVYRQGVGKRGNFLAIYGGEAAKFQESLQGDIGHVVNVQEVFPLDRCASIIRDLKERVYRVHFRWREEQVALAGRQGYLEVPTGWGRTFTGGPEVVKRTYANECSNFPIQTLAAQLVLSAQYAIQKALVLWNLRTVIDLNTYDALRLDCPPTEADRVLDLVKEPLTRPPILRTIESECGRTVPLLYEVKKTDTGCPSHRA